ncbi:MSMEG_0565 family glycosyltransferase [Sporichthya brevicatena]|uniref:MSMEG_0565 family glycosyltransferase n=1 Tax=Sporichthya brevicatena TaxID=171442 RepID=UPI0031D5E774
MSVALLTYSTRPRGGVVHTLALAEALADLGVDVTVWALARGGDETFFRPVDPRVRLRLVPVADREGEEFGERVARSIETLRSTFEPAAYDVVHAQDCITANAAGRCVRTVHHLDRFTTPQLAACHERAIVEPYAHVCVSAAVAGELAAGWGLTATVIPNGVDAARFARAASADPVAVAARKRWRERFGRYVLSVGGIEPRKGSLELLDAMAELRDGTGTEVPLVIAGGTTLFDYQAYRREWEARAHELKIEPHVLGPVPDDELPSLVAGAAVFAFPSTKEGFGLAAMEALAAGVPVVASDLPVLREVFGGAVALADSPGTFADALDAALRSPDPSRVAAGRDLAARYTWSAAAHAHLSLYQSLLTAPAKALTLGVP